MNRTLRRMITALIIFGSSFMLFRQVNSIPEEARNAYLPLFVLLAVTTLAFSAIEQKYSWGFFFGNSFSWGCGLGDSSFGYSFSVMINYIVNGLLWGVLVGIPGAYLGKITASKFAKPKTTVSPKPPTPTVSLKPPAPTVSLKPPAPTVSPVRSLSVQWPAIRDYVEAFQNLHVHILDLGCRGGVVEKTGGLPRTISGNFACVFKIQKGSKEYAVRCFYNSRILDLQERYKAISNHLDLVNMPFFVDFDYIQHGIQVHGVRYPILRMKWAEGEVLNKFLSANLKRRDLLEMVAKEFVSCVVEMQRNKTAHGDLQHGNIKVKLDHKDNTPKIYFVDYDGLYVPNVQSTRAPELGHNNYQHPRRTENHYNEKLDNFSSLVIYLSILAIAEHPRLWREYHDDDRILFENSDFTNPNKSGLIGELRKSPSAKLQKLTELLIDAINNDPLSDIASPDKFLKI